MSRNYCRRSLSCRYLLLTLAIFLFGQEQSYGGGTFPAVAAASDELSPTLLSKLPSELRDYRPPKCPCVRYQPWSTLSATSKYHATALGYGANKWNHHRDAYNEIEELYWDALTPSQQDNATVLFGYGPDDGTPSANPRQLWTCCINHYTWHHWGHMGNWYPEAQAAYALLGYQQSYWNRDFGYPPSEYKHWCRNVTGEKEDACLNELELWALKSVCYATESVYRYDSMVKPVWGRYLKPDHCLDDDEDVDVAETGKEGEDGGGQVEKDVVLEVEDTSDAPTRMPIGPKPTDGTYGPTRGPTPSPVPKEATATPVGDASSTMADIEAEYEGETEICAQEGEKAFDCGAGEKGGSSQSCCDGLICGGNKRCRFEGDVMDAADDKQVMQNTSSAGATFAILPYPLAACCLFLTYHLLVL